MKWALLCWRVHSDPSPQPGWSLTLLARGSCSHSSGFLLGPDTHPGPLSSGPVLQGGPWSLGDTLDNTLHKTWGRPLWLRRAPLKAAAGRGREWTESFEVQSPSGGQRLDGPQDRQGAGCVDLCRGKTQPGWTSSPSPRLPAAARPARSGPPRVRLHAAQAVFHRGNAFFPPGRREGDEGGRRRGRDAPRPAPTKLVRDAGAPWGRLPAGWRALNWARPGSGRKRAVTRREAPTAGGGVGSGRPARTPNSEPGSPTVRPGGLWSISIS